MIIIIGTHFSDDHDDDNSDDEMMLLPSWLIWDQLCVAPPEYHNN